MKFKSKTFSNSSLLIIALMGVNIINFFFNAYLGRVLSFEEFGVITLLNALVYLLVIPCNALYITTNHKVAYLTAHQEKEKGVAFLQTTLKKMIFVSFIVSCFWLLTIPFFDTFFKLNNYFVLLFFTPIITLSVIIAVNKGFLQGIFRFDQVGLILLIEAISKLFFAWVFIQNNLAQFVYLAIPLSVVVCGVFTFLLMPKITAQTVQEVFPQKFFLAAVITGIASSAFLTVDLLLVKHFLSPEEAGQYALLSLVGKMVYFLGFLPNAFMVSFVSRDKGENRDPQRSFSLLFMITSVLSLSALIGLQSVGNILLPLFFGEKTIVILPYLTFYISAITLFVLSSTIVSYHLVLKQYLFSFIAVGATGVMCLGIILFHENIQQITQVIFTVSLMSAFVIGLLHVLESQRQIKLNKNVIYE